MRRGDSRERGRRDSRERGREHRGRSRSNSRDRGRDRKRYRSRSNPKDNSEKKSKEYMDVVKVDIVTKVENPIPTTTVDDEFIFDEEKFRKFYKYNALEENVMSNNIVLALRNINNTVLSAKVNGIVTKINALVDAADNDKSNNESMDANVTENVIDVNIENETKEVEVSMKVDTSYASIDDSSTNILDSIEMDKIEETNDVGGCGDDDGFDLYGDLGMSETVEETVVSEPAEDEEKPLDELYQEMKSKREELTSKDNLEKKASLLTADVVSIPLYLQDMSYNRLCQVTKMNNQKGFSTTMASSIDGLIKLLHC